jgi:hypothetical protein
MVLEEKGAPRAFFILSGDNLTLDTRLRGLFATQSGQSSPHGGGELSSITSSAEV